MLEILVVDDHPLMRAGLECMLDAPPDLHVVGTAASGPQALRLAAQLQPDVVLMDVSLPGMDGVSATRLLGDLRPPPLVVMLTTTCSATLVQQAFAAGAAGFLLKDMPPEDLVAALRGVAEGRAAIDPRAARILSRQQRHADEDARPRGAASPSGPAD